MFFSYLTVILEILSHVFRAIGACALLLTLSCFAGMAAIDMCNGLSAVLGIISVASVILTLAAVYTELEQASEEVRAFRYWRAMKNA